MAKWLLTTATFCLFYSNTDFEKKLEKIIHQRLVDSDVDEIFNEDENSSKGSEKDKETVKAYVMYITEVLSTFVFTANPSVNLDLILPKIKETSAIVVKVAKAVLEVWSFTSD